MAFNFTTNGNNFSSPDAPVSALSPVNTGIESFAQRRLDNIISRANAQYLNALAVDAVPLNIWARTLSGVPCTCCSCQWINLGFNTCHYRFYRDDK